MGHSYAWNNVRQWYGRTRNLRPFQHVHHWFIQRNGTWGRYVADWIKNQPWNLLPMPSRRIHIMVHGNTAAGGYRLNILGRLWYGTPHWAKAAFTSTIGRLARLSNLCKCD